MAKKTQCFIKYSDDMRARNSCIEKNRLSVSFKLSCVLISMVTSVSEAAGERAAGGFTQTRGSMEQHAESSPAAGGRLEFREHISQRPGANAGETATQCVEEW